MSWSKTFDVDSISLWEIVLRFGPVDLDAKEDARQFDVRKVASRLENWHGKERWVFWMCLQIELCMCFECIGLSSNVSSVVSAKAKHGMWWSSLHTHTQLRLKDGSARCHPWNGTLWYGSWLEAITSSSLLPVFVLTSLVCSSCAVSPRGFERISIV